MELLSVTSPPVITQSSSSTCSSRKILINKPTFAYAQSLNLSSNNRRHPKHARKLKFSRTHNSGSIRCSVTSSQGTGEGIKEEIQSKDNDVVFVAGATGKVGSRTVRELLKLGCQVRAGVRSSQKAEALVQSVGQMKLPEGATAVEKLKIVECDLERDKIEQAIGNASVVICCIGASEKEIFDVTGPCRIDYRATKNLIDAATVAGVKHFILVTSLGTNKFGFPAAILNLFWGVLIWKRKAEEALLASGLPYTIVRPGGMERPTDAYKETHNIVLAEEDTLFGGQVSNLQVAELMAFMAKNRKLSYCKVIEVVAETTAPLTPMGDLLTKIPSQRVDTSLEQEKDLEATPLLDSTPPQTNEATPLLDPAPPQTNEATPLLDPAPPQIKESEVQKSTVTEEEPILPPLAIEPNGRPLSPYASYEDLKPPTSPTPTPSTTPSATQAKVLDVVDAESSGSPSVTQTNQPEPTMIVADEEESIQKEIQKTQPLSPYIAYDDLKPPTSPTPTSPAGIKGQGDAVQANSTPTNLAAESNLPEPVEVKETESVQVEVQKTRPLSPYAAYDDLKPPTSPTPPQATGNGKIVSDSPPKEAVPPAVGGDTMEKAPTQEIEKELSNGVATKISYLSPYSAYEDWKPPTSPCPSGRTPLSASPSSMGSMSEISTVTDINTVPTPTLDELEDSTVTDTNTVPTPTLDELEDSTVTDTNTVPTPTVDELEDKPEEKQLPSEPKPRPLSPYTMYDDLKPPSSPVTSLRN